MLFLVNLITSILYNKVNYIIPKVGSIYQKKINIPFIGKQIIEVEIFSSNLALIRLYGLVNKYGSINYFYNDDKYILKFNYNLRKTIKKYKTDITFPYYDVNNDQILFNINIKSIKYSSKIQMNRI